MERNDNNKDRHADRRADTKKSDERPTLHAPRPTRNAPRTALACATIVVLGAAAYSTSFRGAFVFDDTANITSNSAIRDFDISRMGKTRLLPNLTFAINYALGGKAPGSYHLVNLLIHLSCGLILFGLVRRTLRLPVLGQRFAGSADWLALVAAGLWTVHPLTTQAVTYIVQRHESLMSLMYLLTLYSYLRWRTEGGRRWAAATMVAFVLGMMSKPIMVTAPAVLVAYEFIFLSSSLRDSLRRTGWMYGVMLATAAVGAILTQSEMTAAASFSGRFTPLEYAAAELGVVCHYLWLSVWPAKLSVFTDWPKAQGLGDVLPPAILLGAIVAAAVLAWRRGGKGFAFLAIWFFAILAPTSSFIPIDDAIFEHRMYLPLMAVVVLAVVGLHQAGQAVLLRLGAAPEQRRACIIGGACLAGVLAIVLAVCTGQRNLVYQSDEALWKDVLYKQPDNARALTNYGRALFDKGMALQAKALYEKSLLLRPDYSDTWNNLGVACAELNDLDAAVAHYQKAIAVRNGIPFPDARHNLGNALQRQARALREKAAKPGLDESTRKEIEAQAKAKLEEAVAQYDTGLRECPPPLGPRQGASCNMMGTALVQLERWEEAGRCYERAMSLGYEDADLHNNFAVVLNRAGKRVEAIRHLQRALQLRPGDAGAIKNLRILQGGM